MDSGPEMKKPTAAPTAWKVRNRAHASGALPVALKDEAHKEPQTDWKEQSMNPYLSIKVM